MEYGRGEMVMVEQVGARHSDELAPELCEVQGPDQEGGERRGSPPNINLELT